MQGAYPKHTGLNGVEEVSALLRLLDVGVDQKGVGLRVDVLNHDLESIEAASLSNLDLSTETLKQVLVDNAIRGSEESKNVGDEVSLVIVQTVVPVVQVLGQIDLFSSPERSFGLLVHLPDLICGRIQTSIPLFVKKTNLRVTRRRRVATYLMVLDGEKHEATRVLLKQRLVGFNLLNSRSRLGSFSRLLDRLGDSRVNGVLRSRRVLLASSFEVELLDGRVAHLEVLQRGSSLFKVVTD